MADERPVSGRASVPGARPVPRASSSVPPPRSGAASPVVPPPAWAPPTEPPPVKRPKRRSPWWAKALIAFGIVIVLAAAGLLVGVNQFLHQIDKSVQTQNLLGDQGVQGKSIDGPINMLMIGLDTRDNNPGLGSRADSIIIAHVPASHDRVYMVSIPRDTSADLPAFPKTKFAGGSYKINAAFLFGSQNGGGVAGGVQLTAAALKAMTGISFNSALIVNFDGFKDIVTKLGGVTMYVDENTMSLHHGYITGHPDQHAAPWVINPDGTPNHRVPGTTPVIYKKGRQHLSAYDALDYVRCRDFLPFTDYDRQRHQQQFVKALLQEAYDKGISDPTHINDFLKPLAKAFTFDPGSGLQLSDWIFTLKGIQPSSIVTIKTNGGVFYKYTGPAPDDRQALSPDSQTLLADVLADKVDDFIAAHPDWVTQS